MTTTTTVVNDTPLPAVARRWNWGAFLLGPVWGVANRTYLPLLSLVPLFSFVWMFVCGRYGSEWAWRSNGYTAADEAVFTAVQDSWRRGAIFLTLLNVAYTVLSLTAVISLVGVLWSVYGPYLASLYGNY